MEWVGHLRKSRVHGVRFREWRREGQRSAGTLRANDGCLSCWREGRKQPAVGVEVCEEVGVCRRVCTRVGVCGVRAGVR